MIFHLIFGGIIVLGGLSYFFSKDLLFRVSRPFFFSVGFLGLELFSERSRPFMGALGLLALPFLLIAIVELFQRRYYYTLQGKFFSKNRKTYAALEEYIGTYLKARELDENAIRLHRGGILSISHKAYFDIGEDFDKGLKDIVLKERYLLNRFSGCFGVGVGLLILVYGLVFTGAA